MTTNTLNQEVIDALKHAYEMEIETVENYLAASINLDGLRAISLREVLEHEVQDELKHARKLGERIKALGGTVPGSLQMERGQRFLQPPSESTDIVSIVKGVVLAEEAAILHYRRIIEMTDGIDHPTQDLAIEILTDEEGHRREFAGFLRGLQSEIPPSEVPSVELVMDETKAA